MNDGDNVTVRQLWAQTSEVIGARHEARWLCEVATSLDGADFDSALDDPATQRMVSHLDSMVARYRAGEPLQYVLGSWAFRTLDLAVDRRVLIPRPETELVAEVAIDLARTFNPTRTVADLGTGSGAIGLSLAAELPYEGTSVWMTDASADALAVARSNLVGIGRNAANVRVGEGSWFQALPDDERFDVLVSNPPYVAESSPDIESSVVDWEPAQALFSAADGLSDLRHLITGSPDHLSPDGWLVLEMGADQGPAVLGLLNEVGYRSPEIRQDLAGHDRIAIAQRPSIG